MTAWKIVIWKTCILIFCLRIVPSLHAPRTVSWKILTTLNSHFRLWRIAFNCIQKPSLPFPAIFSSDSQQVKAEKANFRYFSCTGSVMCIHPLIIIVYIVASGCRNAYFITVYFTVKSVLHLVRIISKNWSQRKKAVPTYFDLKSLPHFLFFFNLVIIKLYQLDLIGMLCSSPSNPETVVEFWGSLHQPFLH